LCTTPELGHNAAGCTVIGPGLWLLRAGDSESVGGGYPSVDRLIEVLEDKVVRPAKAKFNQLLARRAEQLRVGQRRDMRAAGTTRSRGGSATAAGSPAGRGRASPGLGLDLSPVKRVSSRCATISRLPPSTSPSIKPSMVDGSIRPMNRTIGNAYWRSRPVEDRLPATHSGRA
jgi:hypothetical protein